MQCLTLKYHTPMLILVVTVCPPLISYQYYLELWWHVRHKEFILVYYYYPHLAWVSIHVNFPLISPSSYLGNWILQNVRWIISKYNQSFYNFTPSHCQSTIVIGLNLHAIVCMILLCNSSPTGDVQLSPGVCSEHHCTGCLPPGAHLGATQVDNTHCSF